MTSGTISLVIADEQTMFRQGLVALFSAENGFRIIGEAADGLDAVEQAATLRPDVIILSSTLPRLDGVAATQRIRELPLNIEPVVLATSHVETLMREAFEVGCRAYLLRTAEFQEMKFAVSKAAIGEFFLSGPGGQDVIAEYIQPAIDAQRPGGIMTQRERQISKLLADGYSSREVANILSISPKTAETHRASIMKKLGAKNVTDIVKYCIRNHLIEP